jgi:hypothetical protein
MRDDVVNDVRRRMNGRLDRVRDAAAARSGQKQRDGKGDSSGHDH